MADSLVPASTVSDEISDYAASTTLGAIPPFVRDRAAQVIMDEMASACFGSRSIAGGLGVRYASRIAGGGVGRILGTRLRAAAPYAALANGMAGHGEEVDGAHVVGGHPGATIVHAAVAAAELQHSSGAELLTAVVLGYDVGTRILAACGGLFGIKAAFHLHADFIYSLGAAAAASRILGLDAQQHRHAMALTTFQANGLCALFQESLHISKSFSNGQYAMAGVSGALMASMGFEGCPDVLGSRDGLLDAWGVADGAGTVTQGLGTEYAIMGANFKFFNAGYPIHAPVEVAMALVSSAGIRPEDITGVEVGMASNAMKVVDNRDMHNICLQDMLSAALALGGIGLRDTPFPDVLSNAAYTRLRPLVRLSVDPDLEREQPNGRGASVRITLSDARTFEGRVDHPRGHSTRGGTTWKALGEKWAQGLPDYDIDRFIALTKSLESLEDVNLLTRALSLE